jgi:hypothetical protein
MLASALVCRWSPCDFCDALCPNALICETCVRYATCGHRGEIQSTFWKIFLNLALSVPNENFYDVLLIENLLIQVLTKGENRLIVQAIVKGL